jgi:hypothetical protein
MLRPETADIQKKLATYCRTGEPVELPGIRSSKIHHYRRLVFNVVKNTINQAYPVTREIINHDRWIEMVDAFFREHDCKTPKVWQLPFEFYEYVKNEDFASRLDIPWLNDLLYFEWTEIEVHTMPDEEIPPFCKEGDLLIDPMVINPEHRIIRLEYPVHRISAPATIDKQGNYFVMAFREPETGRVKFIDLTVLHVFAINKVLLTMSPLARIVKDIKEQFLIRDEVMIEKNLSAFMADMIRQKAILGFVIRGV